jgi:hypothetical protein
VNDYALKEAAYVVIMMLVKRPDVRDAMIKSGSRLAIMAYNEFTTDLPESARMKPKDFWDARARGLGGSERDPLCTCAEENVLGFPGDPYSTECILIHEFAHNVHLRGMVNLDPTFDRRLKETYEAAMAKGLWKGKYASVNHHEYFAEGCSRGSITIGRRITITTTWTRVPELRAYDAGLAAMCEEVFRDTEIVYTKPVTRLHGHLGWIRSRESAHLRLAVAARKSEGRHSPGGGGAQSKGASRRRKSCAFSRMKITRISAYRVELPLKEGSYKWSGGKVGRGFRQHDRARGHGCRPRWDMAKFVRSARRICRLTQAACGAGSRRSDRIASAKIRDSSRN